MQTIKHIIHTGLPMNQMACYVWRECLTTYHTLLVWNFLIIT